MSTLKSTLIRLPAVCALVCLSLPGHAATPQNPVATTHASQAASTSATPALLSTPPFVGDDAVAIRDALTKQGIHAGSPSLTERLRDLIPVPALKTPRDLDLAKVNLDRELVFIVPVPYGVLYRSKTHVLTVDADLSGEDAPGAILLRKTITGPRGRGLVVAAEAKAKGYIQLIDLIELKLDEGSKTEVHGRMTLSPDKFAKTNGDFAIALLCRLTPPYLTDQRDHSDPSDDEPTDITTRTSILHTNIEGIWLVSPQSGIVLSKNLHLGK